ncbi:hypothetical protein [uncultured Gammaproteobacteria bacterium]|uniref:hypothetical protein n=1 Tax=Bathymodiolus heckerae thiotrophic gill symbiont TaxID=1052212 RepID=UPI0010B80DA1|nr:hypothetical protein [Bathymodiolus heckerae thiotrophic gill symbiont]CAC9529500.1 hypothetical protein [uncultured Gammaproteobacteria bacterium]CAC9950763.1 hypothetical protein [uncultured Gammaproteobacteria bacterium]CAC9964187.1 hypothetical protein [uncultured Gammaproteobacteria bacterium]SHN91115.1 hypothetical protein BHECKSOX_1396 [Bathymodiolus heckerae thiotrophic gill symbiont]
MRGYSLDPHPSANAAKEEFAVVLIPRVNRRRVPANNVEIVSDLKTAMDQSNPDKNFYAAKVVGPARSSEGMFLYYILEMYNA